MGTTYLYALQQFREFTHGCLNDFFADISVLGKGIVPIVVLAGIFWCLHKKVGRALLFSFTAAYWLVILIKISACVYRPFLLDSRLEPLAKAKGYSFPSAHSVNATAYLGGVAVWQWPHKLLRNTCLFLIVLVLFSRNYLGVHTPQDVLAGCLLTFLIIGAVRKLCVYEQNHPNADFWIAVAGVLLSAALAYFAATKNYPQDTNAAGKLLVNPAAAIKDAFKVSGWGIGFFIGWFIEKRWINFSVDGSWQVRCARFALGVLGLWLLQEAVAPLLGSFWPNIGRLSGAALVSFYITCIVPLGIKFFHR